MGHRACRESQGLEEPRGVKDRQDHRVWRELRGRKANRGIQAHPDHKDLTANMQVFYFVHSIDSN